MLVYDYVFLEIGLPLQLDCWYVLTNRSGQPLSQLSLILILCGVAGNFLTQTRIFSPVREHRT